MVLTLIWLFGTAANQHSYKINKSPWALPAQDVCICRRWIACNTFIAAFTWIRHLLLPPFSFSISFFRNKFLIKEYTVLFAKSKHNYSKPKL